MEEKKINGRKRHILVDTQGFLLACHIHEANILDEQGSIRLITPEVKEQFPKITKVLADRAYRSPCRNHLKTLGWELEKHLFQLYSLQESDRLKVSL